jgi:6-phosphofructokinase
MAAKAMVYLQSGGPTAVINCSLYGAIVEAKKHPEIGGIYGSLNGIEGLINDDLIDLRAEDDETIELFKQTPGALLGTTRFKMPADLGAELYSKVCETVKAHNIGYIFVNGGNDSMDTCDKLSKLFKAKELDVKVIGIPKTVDNDLAVTDHCIGYGSAAKYVINTVKAICVDAKCYKKGKVFIVEIMGRNAGWLTASVDLLPINCRPDLIYLPENVFVMDNFLRDLNSIYQVKGHVIIAISEGIVFERDTSTARVDAFGHIQLGGAADALATVVERKLGLPTRSVELSLPQRADPILVSKVDQEEAFACSKKAVEAALAGETAKMVVIKRLSDKPYKVSYQLAPVSEIANEEKSVPSSMMRGITRLDDSFRDYLRPLIEGEVYPKFKDGTFEIATLKRVKVE